MTVDNGLSNSEDDVKYRNAIHTIAKGILDLDFDGATKVNVAANVLTKIIGTLVKNPREALEELSPQMIERLKRIEKLRKKSMGKV